VRDVIEVGTARAEPGQRGDGVLRVAELNDGTPVDIPVAVVNGTQDGSVLWVQNGVHGMEYVGAGALHRVLRLTSPRLLRGALIAVPMVNILAYRAGARSAPIDGLDMNRIYPGRPLHQVMHVFGHSEVVINKVFNEIRRLATHVIDLHAGGWYTTMSPYAQYLDGDGPYQEASASLARAILRRSDTSITVAQNLCDLCPVALMENVPAAVRLSTPPDGRAMFRIRYAAGRAVKFGSGRQTRPPRRGGGPGGRAPRPRGRWRCRRARAP